MADISNIVCFGCGEKGHKEFQCLTEANRVEAPKKWKEEKKKRKKKNKRMKMLKGPACRQCGKKGHWITQCEGDCPNCDMNHPPEECPTLKITCCLCKGEDHVPSQCPLIRATQPRRMSLPQISQFPAPRPSKGTRPAGVVPNTPFSRVPISEIVCFGCGQKGHYRNECPDKQNPNSRSSTPTPARRNPAHRNAQCGRPNASRERLNHVQAEEAQGSADVILGTIAVNSAPA